MTVHERIHADLTDPMRTDQEMKAAFARVYGDDTLLFDSNEQDLINTHFELYGETPPTGVYPIPFIADNDGFVGADFRRDIL